jgi:Na+/H+-dicarboxylate symporter
LPWFGETLQPTGSPFTRAIQLIVIPLVFSGSIAGVRTRLPDRVAVVAFGWFNMASAFAVLVERRLTKPEIPNPFR